jgi:hypothetical protein
MQLRPKALLIRRSGSLPRDVVQLNSIWDLRSRSAQAGTPFRTPFPMHSIHRFDAADSDHGTVCTSNFHQDEKLFVRHQPGFVSNHITSVNHGLGKAQHLRFLRALSESHLVRKEHGSVHLNPNMSFRDQTSEEVSRHTQLPLPRLSSFSCPEKEFR